MEANEETTETATCPRTGSISPGRTRPADGVYPGGPDPRLRKIGGAIALRVPRLRPVRGVVFRAVFQYQREEHAADLPFRADGKPSEWGRQAAEPLPVEESADNLPLVPALS